MYQVLYGGRSSAKTNMALKKLLSIALEQRSAAHILCTREFQSSIATSTYAELKQIIYDDGLTALFDIKYDHILCKINGVKFIFKGLARDIMQIKSIPNIIACFVEEAETITKGLWEVLDPTLRREGCQLIIAFNPRERMSATYQRWLVENINQEDIFRLEMNYCDNPFNSEMMLKKIAWMREHDYARYEHIYLGKVLDMSEDVIFKNKFKILDMDLKYEFGKYRYLNNTVSIEHGMDFGFSVDPAFLVRICYLNENTIYIFDEICKTGLLPEDYKKEIETKFPETGLTAKWKCDAARPDTIAQLNKLKLHCEAAPKGKGSIEAGIQYLLGKKIIIHPSCTNMIFEAYNYKYKIDKNSGSITSDIIDKNNHGWDATRYALCKQIAASGRRPHSFNPHAMQQLGIS